MRGTLFEDDPFTNVLLNSANGPGSRIFSKWQYFIPLLLLGPISYNLYALLLSLISGEWWKHESFRREVRCDPFLRRGRRADGLEERTVRLLLLEGI